MRSQIETAIRAIDVAKAEIIRIKDKMRNDDKRRDTVDDAEMGADWIRKRLEDLKQSTPVT